MAITLPILVWEPEAPVTERLRFATDIIEHKDGSEQRISLRLGPRQVFDLLLRLDEGLDHSKLDLLLFDGLDEEFGLPIWTEPSLLRVAVAAADTTLPVGSTLYADFRVGGMALVYESPDKYEAVELVSVDGITLETLDPLVNGYEAGTRVLPLRRAKLDSPARERRYPRNLMEYQITAAVIEAPVDLSDGAAFSTYKEKVLFDDPNVLTSEAMDGQYERKMVEIDSIGGAASHASPWDRSRRVSTKGFISMNRADLWAIRRVLHKVRGRQVSFYLPTFGRELQIVEPVVSGEDTLTVSKVGYVERAQNRAPRRDLRITLADGEVLTREVVDSVVAGDTEVLEVGLPINQNIAVEDVSRIDYLEEVRLDTDEVAIEHSDSNGDARVYVPVKTVWDATENEDVFGEPANLFVPMYYNSTKALNLFREPIRGRDLSMPLHIGLSFDDDFEDDPDHGHPDPVSAECLAALHNGGDRHQLDYLGLMVGDAADTSRNPYQIRLNGTDPVWAWSMPAPPGYAGVEKHWWRKLVEYVTPDEVTHTLDIRFVVECSPEIKPGQPSGSGTFGGLWGALFAVYVFSDEVNGDYVDGDDYAPHGNAKHYRNDPLVWGVYYSGFSVEDKLAHPSLLTAAIVPTTFHAPNGYAWVPPDELRFKPCRTKTNAAPWSAGGPEVEGSYNIVFGNTVGSYDMAAMTVGGGASSTLFRWFCFENGAGVGVTALMPGKAGWDEAVGNLTVEAGVSLTLHYVAPRQPVFNPCDGHPLEPLMGVGGTHDCWKSSLSENYFCLPPGTELSPSAIRVRLKEACITETFTYGDFNGLNYDLLDYDCSTGFHTTIATGYLYNYDFAYGADQQLRIMQFRVYVDNPDYERQHWVFTDVADYHAKWSAAVGLWLRTESPAGVARAEVSTVSPGSDVAAALDYDSGIPGHPPLDDFYAEFTSEDTADEVGFRSRWRIITGQPNGYAYTFNRTTHKVRVYEVVNGVWGVIGEATVSLTGDRKIRVRADGATHSIDVLNTGDLWVGVSATGCEFQTCEGDAAAVQGLFVKGAAAAGQVFSGMILTDFNWQVVTANIDFHAANVFAPGRDFLDVSVSPLVSTLYPGCNSESNPGCGVSFGNCVNVVTHTSGTYGFSTVGYPENLNVGGFGEGRRNTICEDPPCLPPLPNCHDCPPPFAAIQVEYLFAPCAGAAASHSHFLSGAECWQIIIRACP